MAFVRPGITQLRDQIVADMLVAAGLPTLLRRSVLRVIAYAQAGANYGQYGYLAWIARQAVPFTATGIFLEAWAALVAVFRKPWAPATGTAGFVGTVGAVVSSGTALRRADGAGYVTTAAATLGSGGTGSAPIQASTAGSAYTINSGDPLSLVSPISGVQTVATGSPTTPGVDPELDAPFRTRMLLRWAQPPQGGAASDYVEWALAVPGVTRAWCNPLGMGPGTVVVYVMLDVAEAAHTGFPQGSNGVATLETRDTAATGDQLAVANALYTLRPATSLDYVCAPSLYGLFFTITTLAAVSSTVQAEVATALVGVLLAKADPLGGKMLLDDFTSAVEAVPGMPDFALLSPSAAGGAVIQAPVGQLPASVSITWVVAS